MNALILAVAILGAAADVKVLDFGTKWCGPCRQMAPEIDRLVAAGWPVQKVDADEQPDLAERYRVTSYPTLVMVDAQGREIDRSSDRRTATDIIAWITARNVAREVARETPGARPTAEVPFSTAVNPSPWETTVRVRIINNRSTSFGSGTVILSNPEASVILTCGHLWGKQRNQAEREQALRRPIKIDLFDGRPAGEPPHTSKIGDADGTVIACDPILDVALIQIKPGRTLKFSQLVPRPWHLVPNMRVRNVSCYEGQDPTMFVTAVTKTKLTDFLTGRPDYTAIECSKNPAQGRSGGGLFTDDGYVIGVCNFAEPQGRHGLYAHPESLYAVWQRAGIGNSRSEPPTAIASRESDETNPVVANETTFQLFKNWCQKNPHPGQKGDRGDPGQNGTDGRNGVDGKNGTDGKDATGSSFDPTAILDRLAAVEKVAAQALTATQRPITFVTPNPDGTMASQPVRLGESLGFKIPNNQALINRVSALEAKSTGK